MAEIYGVLHSKHSMSLSPMGGGGTPTFSHIRSVGPFWGFKIYFGVFRKMNIFGVMKWIFLEGHFKTGLFLCEMSFGWGGGVIPILFGAFS